MVTVVYKIALEIWGISPLKKLAVQKYHNFGTILDNFATCSHISPEWNKISSIGKLCWNLWTFLYTSTLLGERWSTNGEKIGP